MHRTVPFGLICLSLVTIWYAAAGHTPADVTERRERARWYTTKTEPSFDDMTIKLRRVIIAARFRPQPPTRHHPNKPTPYSWPGPPPKHDQPNRETRGGSSRVPQGGFPVRAVAVLRSGQQSQGRFGDRVQRVGAASAFA